MSVGRIVVSLGLVTACQQRVPAVATVPALPPSMPRLAWQPIPADPTESVFTSNLWQYRLGCDEHGAHACYTYASTVGLTESGARAAYHGCELGYDRACNLLDAMVDECKDGRPSRHGGLQGASDEQCRMFRKLFHAEP